MKRVLFVCLGNICRSPMAEAVFNALVKEQGLAAEWGSDSAGTAGYHIGDIPDHRTIAVCKKHGVPVSHRARQLQKADFDEFDFVLCMDESNLESIRRLQSSRKSPGKAVVKLLGEFDPEGHRIVEDPYYGDLSGFETVFEQCRRSLAAFLASEGA